MVISHIIPALTLAATAACLAHPAARGHVPTANPVRESAASTTIGGYVELYADHGIWLLSDGREIRLTGATEALVQHGGLAVIVSGHFTRVDEFWVDGVARADSRSIAVAATR